MKKSKILFIALIILFLPLILMLFSCDSSRSVGSNENDINKIEITGFLTLSEGSSLSPDDITVMTSAGSATLDEDSTFIVEADEAPKHQLIIASSKGKPIRLTYEKVNSNGKKIGLNSRSTALSLIVANPFFMYSSAEQRDTALTRAARHTDFQALVKEIMDIIKTDEENLLDSDLHPEIYEKAARIAADILENSDDFEMRPVAAAFGGKPTILNTVDNGKITFKNPTCVFYGVDLHDIDKDSYDVIRLSRKNTLLSFRWGWPPVFMTPAEETKHPLEDGRYDVRVIKGFNFLEAPFDWQTGNGRGTISNFGQGFIFIYELISGLKKEPAKGDDKLELYVADAAAITIQQIFLDGDKTSLWMGVQVILNDVILQNIDEFVEWYIGSPVSKEWLKNAIGIEKGFAKVVKNLLVGYQAINETAPFFIDLIVANHDIYYFVEKSGNSLVVYENHPPNRPITPIGQAMAYTGRVYQYLSSSTDPDDDDISISFEWGDGTTSEYSDYVPSGDTASMEHAYSEPGLYAIVARAQDSNGILSAISDTFWVEIKNLPVEIDIRPHVYPNFLSPMGLGDVQIAILGSDSLNVNNIEIETVTFENVLAVQSWYKDVSSYCSGETSCGNVCTGQDGKLDLVLKFRNFDIRPALEVYPKYEDIDFGLFGYLNDGTKFEGHDCAQITDEE